MTCNYWRFRFTFLKGIGYFAEYLAYREVLGADPLALAAFNALRGLAVAAAGKDIVVVVIGVPVAEGFMLICS